MTTERYEPRGFRFSKGWRVACDCCGTCGPGALTKMRAGLHARKKKFEALASLVMGMRVTRHLCKDCYDRWPVTQTLGRFLEVAGGRTHEGGI